MRPTFFFPFQFLGLPASGDTSPFPCPQILSIIASLRHRVKRLHWFEDVVFMTLLKIRLELESETGSNSRLCSCFLFCFASLPIFLSKCPLDLPCFLFLRFAANPWLEPANAMAM